ncbi:M23 family metallopeptidase [Georgenia faecalis]|uniref:M23 family metallopeptidase n=1 Tax=Georgenia faecalis TaxID=2483799 RepID=A0ABV9DBL2_9MICO|nr:peptidoglycan DD-metalloendopeptidase family protein [Georgenia faecalis]
MVTTTGPTAATVAGLALAALAWLAGPLAPGAAPEPRSAAVLADPARAPSAPPAPLAAGPPSGLSAPVEVAYQWPTGAEVPVARPFDRPAQPWASGHRGVDLTLGEGAPVHAAGDGVVAFAGVVVDRPVVSVQHADGIRTTYEPVAAAVAAGTSVRAGQVIGTLALPHHCGDRACLHWGARRGADDYVDPLSLLQREVVIRLLPG